MKAQIWISTVIYILIGLAIISALLIAAKPKIDEARDRFTINYMINALNSLDNLINEVSNVPGTKRSFELKLNKGEFKVIPQQDKLEYIIITKFKFSEPNKLIQIGKINLLTTETRGKIQTKLWINYSAPINITTAKAREGSNITITSSSTPYKLWIENLGQPLNSANYTIYISVS